MKMIKRLFRVSGLLSGLSCDGGFIHAHLKKGYLLRNPNMCLITHRGSSADSRCLAGITLRRKRLRATGWGRTPSWKHWGRVWIAMTPPPRIRKCRVTQNKKTRTFIPNQFSDGQELTKPTKHEYTVKRPVSYGRSSYIRGPIWPKLIAGAR